MNLKQYLIEALMVEAVSDGGFKEQPQSVDDIMVRFKRAGRQFGDDSIEIIRQFYELIWNDNEGVNPFVLNTDQTKTTVKIRYFVLDTTFSGMLNDKSGDLDSLGFPQITYKDCGRNKYRFYIAKGNRSVEFAETGNGSVGRITTATQEGTLCNVFNHLTLSLTENDNDIIVDLNGNLQDILGNVEDPTWKKSFICASASLFRYITGNNGINVNNVEGNKNAWIFTGLTPGNIKQISNYRLEKFGGYKDSTDYEWKLCDMYTAFINAYTKYFTGSLKDHWDPSDVILYDITKVENLENLFKSMTETLNNGSYGSNNNPYYQLTNDKTVNDIQEQIYTLYNDKSKPFAGISLKKVSKVSTPEKYNLPKGTPKFEMSVNDYNLVSRTDKGNPNQLSSAYIECYGKYNIPSQIDTQTGETTNGETLDAIKLELRSFGAGIIAMDIILSDKRKKDDSGYSFTSPALGKVPKSLWVDILNNYKKESDKYDNTNINDKDLNECVTLFVDFFGDITSKDRNDRINKLHDLIMAGIKNGPNCLPFVLLH